MKKITQSSTRKIAAAAEKPNKPSATVPPMRTSTDASARAGEKHIKSQSLPKRFSRRIKVCLFRTTRMPSRPANVAPHCLKISDHTF